MRASTVRRYRPALEVLEDRCTPAGTVQGAFVRGTWTLTGDAEANSIVIASTGTPGQFRVTGDTTTVTGPAVRGNVRNIVLSLGEGQDVVRVAPGAGTASRANLAGNLKIDGSDGANRVHLDRLVVGGNVRITNGTNTTGRDLIQITDSSLRGNVTVINGDGDTQFDMWRTPAEPSSIGGTLSITNGTGYDSVTTIDTSIGGSVLVHNGQGNSSGQAGFVWIYNEERLSRSVIGGHVKVTYLTGEVNYDGIWDTEVKGNVTFDHGTGKAWTDLSGYSVSKPVLIRGNLILRGSGPLQLDLGTRWRQTGVVVGKNLTITGGSEADTISAYKLTVGGTTRIDTGDGADVIDIQDSVFRGPDPRVASVAVEILTGPGNDTVSIDTNLSFTGATEFVRVVRIDLGEDDDTLTLGFAGDAGRQVRVHRRAVFLGNAGDDTLNQNHLVALLGAPIISNDFESASP